MRPIVVVALVGLLLGVVYYASSSWMIGPDSVEPSNIVAVHQAERGLLHQPALVEFYSEDCWTCRQIQGPLADLDQEFASRIRFIYIDMDLATSQPSAVKYHVRGIPTFVLLDAQGQEVMNLAGWPGQKALADDLANNPR